MLRKADITTELKQDLHKQLRIRLQEFAAQIEQAARAAHEGATHEDAVAKSKYDTHGLELSYLAASQTERLSQLKNQLLAFSKVSVSDQRLATEITQYAVIAWLDNQQRQKYCFICSVGAGQKLHLLDYPVEVITPQSPLGAALLGLAEGEMIDLDSSPDPVGQVQWFI